MTGLWPDLEDSAAVAGAMAQMKGSLQLSQAAARIMKEQEGGVILNTSSIVSSYGQPPVAGYPASKFAVNGMSRSPASHVTGVIPSFDRAVNN